MPSVAEVREERTRPRGEAGRVAARVRELLGERVDAPPPLVAQAALPAALPAVPELPAPTLGQRVAARVPVRLDPGRRAAVAVGLAVLVAAGGTGVWLMSARPRAMPVSATAPGVSAAPPLAGSSGSGASPPVAPPLSGTLSGSASAAATELVVDVAGKVRHPGLYRLEPGARVDDAITAAGGPVGHVDLSRLNLAAKVVDGQQIAVGLPGAAGGGPPPGGVDAGGTGGGGAGAGGGTTGGAPVSLNSASLEQLEQLPGVGPVLGQHILDWRTQHGGFASIDQLQDVSGIGDVKFAALKPLVTL